LTCRSPAASPRREGYDVAALRIEDSPEKATRATHLAPPGFSLRTPDEDRILSGRDDDEGVSRGSSSWRDEEESTIVDDSPTEWDSFLPEASPGIPRDDVLKFDEKLGVLSTINIIVGKTVGVGAYTVPSAIFAGVGSVGMTLAVWIIGSIISFCGLAVYLVS
jgi:hypothetical protein